MYFTGQLLLPENQDPLIITAAPYGPIWMPADLTKTFRSPGMRGKRRRSTARMPALRFSTSTVRDPKTGHVSKNLRNTAI